MSTLGVTIVTVLGSIIGAGGLVKMFQSWLNYKSKRDKLKQKIYDDIQDIITDTNTKVSDLQTQVSDLKVEVAKLEPWACYKQGCRLRKTKEDESRTSKNSKKK